MKNLFLIGAVLLMLAESVYGALSQASIIQPPYPPSKDFNGYTYRQRNTFRRLYQHTPLRVAFLSDVSFAESIGSRCIERSLTNFLTEQFALQYGSMWYMNPSGGATTVINDNDAWGQHYHMPNASQATSFSPQTADTLTLFWVMQPGFGTLLVETNNGGAYATALTLPGANATTIGRYTNITFVGTPNFSCRVTSTGNNIFVGASMFQSNSTAMFRINNWIMGGTEVISNAAYMVPWEVHGPIMQGLALDLMIIGSKDSYLAGMPNFISAFEAAMSTNSPNTDIWYVSQSDSLDGVGHQAMIDMRKAWLATIPGSTRGAFYDGMYYFDGAGDTNYFTIPQDFSDTAHPQLIWDDFMSFELPRLLHLDTESMTRFGYLPTTVTAVSAMNVLGGNLRIPAGSLWSSSWYSDGTSGGANTITYNGNVEARADVTANGGLIFPQGLSSTYQGGTTLLSSNVATGTYNWTNNASPLRQAVVYVTGGTVSGIGQNKTLVGSAAGSYCFIVQPNEEVDITNTVAPVFKFKYF